MSDIKLCPVCLGEGVTHHEMQTPVSQRCPNGCIGIRVLVSSNLVTPLEVWVTRYLDPAHHALWCKTHYRPVRGAPSYCDGWDNEHNDWLPSGYGHRCNIVVVEVVERGRPA